MSNRVALHYNSHLKEPKSIQSLNPDTYPKTRLGFVLFTLVLIVIGSVSTVFLPWEVPGFALVLFILIFVAVKNKIFDFLWWSCLLTFTFVQWFPAFQSVRFVTLVLLIAYGIYALRERRIEKNAISVGLVVVGFYSVATSFQSYSFTVALLKSISLLLLAGVLFILPSLVRNQFYEHNCHEQFLKLYLSFALIVVFSNALYYCAFPSSSNVYYSGTSFLNGRFRGWFINPNDLATLYSVFFIPAIWFGIHQQKNGILKLGLYVAFILAVVELAATQSRAGIFSGMLAISVLVSGTQKSGSRILILASTIIFLLMIYTANPNNNIIRRLVYRNEIKLDGSGRLQYWAAAWDRFLKKPIFGAGFGISNNSADSEGLVFNTQGYKIQIDNSYISLLEELGIIGCTLLITTLLAPIVIKSWYIFRTAGLLVLGEPALVFVAVMAAGLFNALFESWLMSVGNVCGLSFWMFASFPMMEKYQVVMSSSDVQRHAKD